MSEKDTKEYKENAAKSWSDIPSFTKWESVEPVEKGWSDDKKYIVKTLEGEKLLLRIAAGDLYDAKKKEYEIITKYASTGIKMSLPLEFGWCDGGKSVYMLLSWVDGEDLEQVLPHLSEKDQYALGRQAGTILRKIHSIPLEPADIPEKTKKDKKLFQLSRYEESDLRLEGDETAVKFVKGNINKIWKQPPVYLHGDYHPGNLIFMGDGNIGVIDFNRWEVGDPYEEFYKLESFGIELSIPYCIGQIDAYFDDDIPGDFWTATAVYVAHASLYSIKWAEKFGQDEIDGMVRRAKQAFEDYDGFKRSIPRWYTEKYRKP
ncbi:MAG: phosphotransferase [Lachnospiraceae bacterium]|nr:phosphotransferase [Lachnospiraceae bacterium]